ncbi:hypothetical protein GO013_15990 [Pseudodesulfovibrio sp. JC047]|uniref:hypothetical protein n=1 Tax=Pseudodesulfovibrio sp. JC047 TaxID=2683199 RepID=UPI0013D2375F|nr:hypothetical protein [Pseudodesulfovibrio sp. JC047]NDV20912.1 hypothetical protein [Pseudodesulfovibrio sp. JC047]
MPAIERTHFHGNETDMVRNRIQELKTRAAEGLDDALNIVAKSLGREETPVAKTNLAGLETALSPQEADLHSLDALKVLDLISDPFEDD